jgi:lysophospholipase L1-like esterase
VAFGDSITWGEDGNPPVVCGPNTNGSAIAPQFVRPYNRVTSPGPYPAVLQTSLKTRYVNQSSQIVVDNVGKPGEATYGDGIITAVTRFRTEISSLSTLGTPYQGVLLMEGTNDIFYGNDDSKIAQAVANLGVMIDDAKSRGLRVLLATIPPMVPGGVRACGNHEVAPLNDGIRALAAQKSVALVDVYMGLGPSSQQYISSDGVHPNQAGYVKIASIFFDVMTAALETARQPSRSLR